MRAVSLVLVLALVQLAACGDDSSSPATTAPPGSVGSLSGAERAQAGRSVAAIRGYCRRVARYVTGEAGPPASEATDRALEGARRIAALARTRPGARYRDDVTARDLASDLAEDLEGTNCSSRLVSELSRGIP